MHSFAIHVRIDYLPPFEDAPALGLVDLSKATELKNVVFVPGSNPRWISLTLQTITHNHTNPQRVSVMADGVLLSLEFIRLNPMPAARETFHRGWLELDHLLTQLCESHLIHAETLYRRFYLMGEEKARSSVESLLPELTKRGLVNQYEGDASSSARGHRGAMGNGAMSWSKCDPLW